MNNPQPQPPSLDSQNQWLSIGDAAELLSISRDTLRRWEKVGKIQVYRSPTNRRQYKKSELEELYKTKSTKSPLTPTPKSISTPSTVSSPPTPTTSAPSVVFPAIPSIPSAFSKTAEQKIIDNQPLLSLTSQPLPPASPPSPTTIPDSLELPTDIPTTSTPTSTPIESSPPFVTETKPLPPSPPASSFLSHLSNQPSIVSPLPSVPTSTPSITDISALDLEESKTPSAQILKIAAIVLSAILIFLGITITILVFL